MPPFNSVFGFRQQSTDPSATPLRSPARCVSFAVWSWAGKYSWVGLSEQRWGKRRVWTKTVMATQELYVVVFDLWYEATTCKESKLNEVKEASNNLQATTEHITQVWLHNCNLRPWLKVPSTESRNLRYEHNSFFSWDFIQRRKLYTFKMVE